MAAGLSVTKAERDASATVAVMGDLFISLDGWLEGSRFHRNSPWWKIGNASGSRSRKNGAEFQREHRKLSGWNSKGGELV